MMFALSKPTTGCGLSFPKPQDGGLKRFSLIIRVGCKHSAHSLIAPKYPYFYLVVGIHNGGKK
jgi:hypothetical protein